MFRTRSQPAAAEGRASRARPHSSSPPPEARGSRRAKSSSPAFYRYFLTGRNLTQPIFGPGRITDGTVWTSAPVRYRELGKDHLAPLPVRNSPDIWATGFGRFPVTYDEADVQFRRLRIRETLRNAVGAVLPPTLLVVGRFDPRKLPGFSPLSRVPLET